MHDVYIVDLYTRMQAYFNEILYMTLYIITLLWLFIKTDTTDKIAKIIYVHKINIYIA